MASLNTLIERMRYWCVSVSLGYSQTDRWNIRPGGNCDCSSLVIHCLREAGFDTGSASYTGNMSANLTARGWRRMPVDGNPHPGDILLNDYHHVAVYLGGGKLAQASISENNTISGVGGDQTGRETNVRNYYNYPWNCYLRFMGESEDNMTSAGDVWNYGLGEDATSGKNNLPAWVRLSWVHHDTAALYRILTRTDDGGTKDGSSGDIYTRVCFIDKRVRELAATVTAQAAAIEALSKALGSNPADVAKIVEDAVTKKLDALEINVTATSKEG